MRPVGGEPVRFARYVAEPGVLDDVIKEIQAIARKTGLERSLAVGRLVFRRFFGGSIQAWKERRRNKNNSVRRLAEHPACPLSKSAINQAIGIYVAVEALPCVQTFGHIGSSHVAAVLHLDVDAQRHWLERAEGNRWGVRQLTEQVTQDRRQSGERRGRPKASHNGHVLSKIAKLIGVLEQTVAELDEASLQVSDKADLAVLRERFASVEGELLRVFRRPIQSGPCASPLVLAKSDGGSPFKSVVGERARL
jgi:hypothetical protein